MNWAKTLAGKFTIEGLLKAINWATQLRSMTEENELESSLATFHDYVTCQTVCRVTIVTHFSKVLERQQSRRKKNKNKYQSGAHADSEDHDPPHRLIALSFLWNKKKAGLINVHNNTRDTSDLQCMMAA